MTRVFVVHEHPMVRQALVRLDAMRERASFLHGRLEASSTPGRAMRWQLEP